MTLSGFRRRKEIDEKLPVGMTAGDRYPAESMKAVNR
jgi:hypothetical protein